MSPRQQNPSDPAAETVREHPTQVISGLSGGHGGPERPTQREADDVLNRSAEERYDTPRRYERESSDE